jgi:nucleotide-binding universal stress UspA family protein
VRLALDLDAALTIVHVFEPPSYAFTPTLAEAETEARVRRSFDEQVALVRQRLPQARAVLKEGTAWREIVDVTHERRADLVVLSTRGRHGLAVLGSVAAKIVRVSPVPVITAAPPAWSE